MHGQSYREMAANIIKYIDILPTGSLVVDIGSMDINGTYRPLIEPRLKYYGIDLAPGLNVDFVMPSEFDTGLPADSADAVLCGQCLEHCRNPFRLMAEAVRIAKFGAPLLIVAPFVWIEHRYPIDCWRFLPDGMRILFEQAGAKCLETYFVGYDSTTILMPGLIQGTDCWGADCWGIGRKE